MSDILDLIDGALDDYKTSQDAMRWAPHGDEQIAIDVVGPSSAAHAPWINPAIGEASGVPPLTPWQERFLSDFLRVRLDDAQGVYASAGPNVRIRLYTTAYEPEIDQHAHLASAQYHSSGEIFEWSDASYVVIDEVHNWIPVEAYCRNVRERAARLSRMRAAYRRRKR